MPLFRFLFIAGVIAVALSGALAAECPPLDPRSPRTLILALDGVPYESVRVAQELGAFRGWARPRPMVSPFPSMTNVGFAAILHPFGAGPIPGYEVRLYDPESRNVEGGGITDLKFSNIDHDLLRNIRRQTDNIQFPYDMIQGAAVILDTESLAFRGNRNFNFKLFRQ